MKKDISFLRMKKVLNVLLVAILVLALFGIFEYAAKSHPFASYFDASGMLRLRSAEKYRVLGTVGHILFPILMLAGCMIVRHNIRRFWVRLPVYVFLIGAATLSQTRVLLMACIFYVVGTEVALAISRSRGELAGLVKPLVAAAALLGVAAVALMQSAAGKQLMERFFSDAGSGKARIIQIEYFLNNIFSMPMYGIGAFADTVVLTDPDTGAQIIAEIPWINLYFEVGPLFLLLLLVFLFAVIFSGPLWFELLVLMGAFSPYTTLTSKTCCFFLFFVFAAYSITMKRQKASAAADTTDRPLYPVLPPGRRRGVAAVVCAGVLALVLAAGAAAGAAKVAVEEKLYRASADLMVVLEPELPEDVAFAQQEGGQAVRYSRYIGDDIVAMAHSDQIIYLMREKFYKETGTWLARADYSERLQLANMYESRVVRVYYSDTDPERAALVATCFAGAIEEFTTKLGGFRQVKVAEEAAVPVGYVAPRPVAVTVVMALFAATVFLIGFLGVGAIGNLVRDYGQPLVIFEKRMFKRPRKGKPLAQGRVVYRSAGRGGGEGGAGR